MDTGSLGWPSVEGRDYSGGLVPEGAYIGHDYENRTFQPEEKMELKNGYSDYLKVVDFVSASTWCINGKRSINIDSLKTEEFTFQRINEYLSSHILVDYRSPKHFTKSENPKQKVNS